VVRFFYCQYSGVATAAIAQACYLQVVQLNATKKKVWEV